MAFKNIENQLNLKSTWKPNSSQAQIRVKEPIDTKNDCFGGWNCNQQLSLSILESDDSLFSLQKGIEKWEKWGLVPKLNF